MPFRPRTTFDQLFARTFPLLRVKPVDLKGHTAVVTGSNTGIGLEVARKLANMGATVILACRSREKAEAAKMEIVENPKGAVLTDNIEVEVLDCADLGSVRDFARRWGDRRLDILVNNAGITSGTYLKNPQGFEQAYVTNLLSHYLLTLLLLPHMNQHGRIVNVSSVSNYDCVHPLRVDDLDDSKFLEGTKFVKVGQPLEPADTLRIYAQTKYMQVLFTKEMQSRLEQSTVYRDKSISVNVCHPGVVRTSIWERPDGIHASWMSTVVSIIGFIGISPEQGACTAVHLAVSPDAAIKNGRYWDRMGVRPFNSLVDDAKAASEIWERWAEHSELEKNFRL